MTDTIKPVLPMPVDFQYEFNDCWRNKPHWNGCYASGSRALYTESQLLAYTAAAVAAERERCAYLAESWPVYVTDRPSSIAVRIAAAIRKGTTP